MFKDKSKTKKKASRGTIIFYSIYAAFVLLALGAIFALMFPLNSWLESYQASQPENKSSNLLRDTRYVVEPELISLKYIGYLYRQSGQTYIFRARTYFF